MQNTPRTRVLIVNDDGFKSGNLRALAAALSKVADVFVFAPETEQSGVSQAFTVRRGLCVKQVPVDETTPVATDGTKAWPYEFYSVSGTPADCAKFGLGHFAKFGLESEPEGCAGVSSAAGEFDVCFSGVNVGENAGVSSLYSGTVAGAREAALWGVPGIALSLRGCGGDLLQTAVDFAVRVVKDRLFERIAPATFWNVNFPKVSEDKFKGYKSTKMAHEMFTDHYSLVDADDGSGDKLWLLDGDKLWNESPVDSDDYLLNQGYATITPHHIDQTDDESLKKIKEMINEKLVGGGL
ncbi:MULTISPECIES: 5'/3'-nucleotidase SurE [unclassified Fibrobacter]|uniref:5'/3'-nucleotidase SurE n=1 Tax=unclassified Fibrobacter TaxID=2634177 RepID=UPI000D6B3538|nr:MULTISPECIES: 5'/3'-nucleotidase SurE [unclassified Fibrobacter]PWJ71657.1 5'-nucleotidase /3'-nucleotidase /exopolyphosphatase [Fibrobacter sp. UWR4]PZW65101.1 5'-nucleotidase /3'-nucleotidase /exopolyphosphatase [Fibrobacter sp. UWR1]